MAHRTHAPRGSRHSPHDARLLILSYRVTAGSLDRRETPRAVRAHPREDDPDGLLTEERRGALEEWVRCGNDSVLGR